VPWCGSGDRSSFFGELWGTGAATTKRSHSFDDGGVV